MFHRGFLVSRASIQKTVNTAIDNKKNKIPQVVDSAGSLFLI